MRTENCTNDEAEWMDDSWGSRHIERNPQRPYMFGDCRECNGMGTVRVFDLD